MQKMKSKKQKEVKGEDPDYGIRKYSKDQKQLHLDMMGLLTSERFKKIPADDCLIVFGRVYSVYVSSQLLKEKRILMSNKVV